MHHLVKCLLCVMILNLPVFCWGEVDGELYLVERQVDSQSSVERDSVAKDLSLIHISEPTRPY